MILVYFKLYIVYMLEIKFFKISVNLVAFYLFVLRERIFIWGWGWGFVGGVWGGWGFYGFRLI